MDSPASSMPWAGSSYASRLRPAMKGPLRTLARVSRRLSGGLALAWARSRTTEEQHDGVWRIDGRQRLHPATETAGVALQGGGPVASFSSLGSFTSVAQEIAEAVKLDEGSRHRGFGLRLAVPDSEARRVAPRRSSPMPTTARQQERRCCSPSQTFNSALAEGVSPGGPLNITRDAGGSVEASWRFVSGSTWGHQDRGRRPRRGRQSPCPAAAPTPSGAHQAIVETVADVVEQVEAAAAEWGRCSRPSGWATPASSRRRPVSSRTPTRLR